MNKIFLIPLLACLLLLMAGCPHYRMQLSSIPHADNGWQTYGGNIERKNNTLESVIPPLDSLWEYDAEAGFGHSPALASGDYLFVGNLRGEIHSIDIETGKKAGVYRFGASVVGTPTIDGDTLYVAAANEEEGLTAFNLGIGKKIWQVAVGDVESSPLLLDGKLYITTLEGKLICLEKANGKIVWSYQITTERKTRSIHSSPASDGDVIVFGADGGALYAVDAKSGVLRWSVRTSSSIFSTPSINNGRVFIGSTDSVFYAVDISTGKQLWSKILPGKTYSSSAVDEDHIYISIIGREIYCLNSDNGEIVWKTNVNSIINSTPLLAGNILYIGTLSKTIIALDAATGKIIWQHKTEGRVKSQPVVFRKHLFIFPEDRSVICFGESKR